MALLLTGCKKDKDTQAPQVEILAPAAGAALSIPDTLTVRVRCNDDHELRSLTITLTDASGATVAPGVSINLSGTSSDTEVQLIVTDETVTSGTCTLTARATDGVQDGRAFREVFVIEAPLRLRGLYASQPGGGGTTIHRIDTAGDVVVVGTLPHPYQLLAGHSSSDRIFLAGSVNGPLTTFGTEPFTQVWQQPNPNFLPVPYHSGLHAGTDKVLYVATVDDLLRGYQMVSGGQVYNALLQSGWRVGGIVVAGERLATEQYAVAGSDRRITVYNRSSGTVLDQYPLDLETSAMFNLDGQRILVMGDRAGDGVVQQRDLTNGNIQEPLVLASQPIVAACHASGNTYVLVAGDQVLRYTHPSSLATSLASLPGANAVTYDASRDLVFIAQGNTVHGLSTASGALMQTIALPGAVASLTAVLNR